MDQADRQERIGRNQTTFRRVNEALEPDGNGGRDIATYLCECGRLGCTETVAIERSAYEAVRTSFDRFMLVPGHEDPQADAVAEDHGDYLVVIKRGAARDVAEDEDPRGDEVAGR